MEEKRLKIIRQIIKEAQKKGLTNQEITKRLQKIGYTKKQINTFLKTKKEDKANKKAPQGQEFWTSKGDKITSQKELITHLKKMDEETFKNHVNQEKNDFANWIEHVFHNKKIAKEMRKIKEKKELIILLTEALL